ncbi:MAG: hypothetical protein AMXMBFR61_19220 [Fimbriimonadales bacterium]
MKLARNALLAIALLAFAAPVGFAQANFPDVPESHWAYDALETLKGAGLLVGYPDGTFRGARPLSRYEFAVAVHGAYKRFMALTGDLSSKIDAVQSRIDGFQVSEGPTDAATTQELAALRAELEALKSQMGEITADREALNALNRLAKEFEAELASLGVDLAALRQDLKSLGGRLDALENRKDRVQITGDFNVAAIGKHSIDNLPGVDWTGNPVGTRSDGSPSGLTGDLNVMQELGLQVRGTFGRNVRLDSDLVFSSLLGYEGNSFSEFFPGTRKTSSGTDIFVNRLAATFDANWLGNPLTVSFGRIGKKVSPYVMQRHDPDPYLDIARYDNGEWAMDGAAVRMDFETVGLELFLGKQSGRGDTSAASDYTMRVGDNRTVFDYAARPAGINQGLMVVDTELGANLDVKFGRSRFNLAYIAFDGEPTVAAPRLGNAGFEFNRVAVFGGGLRMGLADSLFINADFSASQAFYNGSSRLNADNFAYDVGVRFASGDDFDFGVGWREIRPFFSAPGNWGRIGFWHSPTDIKGLTLGGRYRFNSAVGVTAQGEFYQGTGTARDTSGNVVGLGTDDRINRLQFGLDYRMNPRWKIMLGWEGVYWDLKDRAVGFGGPFVGGKPTEYYYTLGLDYGMGDRTNLRFLYQLSDYDGKNVAGFNTPGNSSTRAKGGQVVTQLSVEF